MTSDQRQSLAKQALRFIATHSGAQETPSGPPIQLWTLRATLSETLVAGSTYAEETVLAWLCQEPEPAKTAPWHAKHNGAWIAPEQPLRVDLELLAMARLSEPDVIAAQTTWRASVLTPGQQATADAHAADLARAAGYPEGTLAGLYSKPLRWEPASAKLEALD